MTTTKLNKIMEMKAKGETTRAIGAAVDMNYSSISRATTKPDVKAMIEHMQERIASECYESAVDNVVHAVKSYKAMKVLKGYASDPQLREHGYKASMRLMESMGILPSHSTSIMVQNIFNQGTTYLTPDLEALLAMQAGIIDVSPDSEE